MLLYNSAELSRKRAVVADGKNKSGVPIELLAWPGLRDSSPLSAAESQKRGDAGRELQRSGHKSPSTERIIISVLKSYLSFCPSDDEDEGEQRSRKSSLKRQPTMTPPPMRRKRGRSCRSSSEQIDDRRVSTWLISPPEHAHDHYFIN